MGGGLQGMVMPPRVAPVQVVGINIPNSKLSTDDRLALQNKVLCNLPASLMSQHPGRLETVGCFLHHCICSVCIPMSIRDLHDRICALRSPLGRRSGVACKRRVACWCAGEAAVQGSG